MAVAVIGKYRVETLHNLIYFKSVTLTTMLWIDHNQVMLKQGEWLKKSCPWYGQRWCILDQGGGSGG